MSSCNRTSRPRDNTNGGASGKPLPPDVSLGSCHSSFSVPMATRKPSGSSHLLSSAPIVTPSPMSRPSSSGEISLLGSQRINSFALRDVYESLDPLSDDTHGEESLISSPGKGRWDMLSESTNCRGGKNKDGDQGPTMTLREQQKLIDEAMKENFSLKLKVHSLEERLDNVTPDQLEAVRNQNVLLRNEVRSQRVEMKQLKKSVVDAERAVADLQSQKQHSDTNSTLLNEERAWRIEVEQTLEEREGEIRSLRRRIGARNETIQARLNALLKEKEDCEAGLEAANAKVGAQAKRINELEQMLENTKLPQPMPGRKEKWKPSKLWRR